jgi:hypothetical protein
MRESATAALKTTSLENVVLPNFRAGTWKLITRWRMGRGEIVEERRVMEKKDREKRGRESG